MLVRTVHSMLTLFGRNFATPHSVAAETAHEGASVSMHLKFNRQLIGLFWCEVKPVVVCRILASYADPRCRVGGGGVFSIRRLDQQSDAFILFIAESLCFFGSSSSFDELVHG
jgi:hypothetical protein